MSELTVKPLTKEERESFAANARMLLVKTPLTADERELCKRLLRYEATVAELESRVPPSVPTDDYANRNIRTVELANAVARHLGLKPQDEIPFEELTRRLRQVQSPAPEGATPPPDLRTRAEIWRDQTSRSSGEDQTAAATEYPGCAFDCPYPAAARVVHLHLSEFCDESLPFADMIADASRRAAAALKDARHWLSISEGNYRDMERQRDQITAEIASLKQQVIDSALRAERLEAKGEPTAREVISWMQMRPGASWAATIKDIEFARRELAAGGAFVDYNDPRRPEPGASLSPQPAPPTASRERCPVSHPAFEHGQCRLVAGHLGKHEMDAPSWNPLAFDYEPLPPQPAEPTGATTPCGKSGGLTEWTCQLPEGHEGPHLHFAAERRCPCCGQPKDWHSTSVASHPAEPERETTR